MCGLAGFTNVPPFAPGDPRDKRVALARHLGLGVDDRGGHAAGYVSAGAAPGSSVHYGRKIGEWSGASLAFVTDATRGDTTIIHARYATCGKKDAPEQAHPFAVKRPDPATGHERTVLWGCHNGMLDGTHATARAHGRTHDVDSREAFELLADGHVEMIRSLQGYGVLTWIERAQRDRVRLVRLSEDSELVVARTECKALVWASTWKILENALSAAGMRAECTFNVEVGKVYEAHASGEFTYSLHPDIKVAARVYTTSQWAKNYHEFRDDAEWGSDPGDCPTCKSQDTWAFSGMAECSDCGIQWPFDAPDVATDAPHEASDDWDDEAWERWLQAEERALAEGESVGRRCT
jgi:hypothetical protein